MEERDTRVTDAILTTRKRPEVEAANYIAYIRDCKPFALDNAVRTANAFVALNEALLENGGVERDPLHLVDIAMKAGFDKVLEPR